MGNHTAGPWGYKERNGRHTRLPFIVAPASPEEAFSVVADVAEESDARLIAAAPDLLTSVLALLELADEYNLDATDSATLNKARDAAERAGAYD